MLGEVRREEDLGEQHVVALACRLVDDGKQLLVLLREARVPRAERRAPMMRSRGAAIFEGGEEKRILQKEF